MPLAKFKCPKCGRTQEALPSSAVQHRCPADHNKMTTFIKEG